MKRADVGNFRVLLDDRGEGAIVIDHVNEQQQPTVSPHYGRVLLEPGELQDLLVALDAVQGDQKPRTDLVGQIVAALRSASHALHVFGLRHKLELHLNRNDLLEIAHLVDTEPTMFRHDTFHLDVYGFRLVAQHGKYV